MINKRYIISKKIGEGRSKVYNVIDTEFPEREVAAKFLPVTAASEEKEKFREEFFTLQKLDHPNIIKSFELNSVLIKDDEEEYEIEKLSSFITMEYFPGQKILDYYGLNQEKNLIAIIKQICSVLYYLHQSNYIYYDLKDENILVSDSNNQPEIRLIDLGFAYNIKENTPELPMGSPLYLAPELLKDEEHDHRVDFYSLGVLIYRIVYGIFPFSGINELEIYKAHIENEVYFPESKISPLITKVISKLLKKDPSDRYQNALQILADLKIPIDIDITKDFIPAKIFSDRKDALNILGTYIKDKSSNDVFTINGFDGSGKSSLLRKINRQNFASVLVENSKTKSGLDSLRYVFRKIIFTETVFIQKENEFEKIAEDVCDEKSEVMVDVVKRVFNTMNPGTQLIVLFDDFNLYDDFTKETLIQLIRIFQIKGIKVILSETLDLGQDSSSINNLYPIQLNQFTEHQLSEFIDQSYLDSFPKEKIEKLILIYSDLLPGSIRQFIKDLILLKVMRYENGEVIFETNEQIDLILQSSHEELYRIRLSNLSSTELRLAQIISAFDIAVEQTVLSALLDISAEKLKHSLNELEKKNIIESLNISNAPRINSTNFKKYIYSTINNKTQFYLIHANAIKKLFPDFNTVELARLYEVANEFEKSVSVLQKEIEKAEKAHYYSYKRLLLEKAGKFLLQEETHTSLTAELVKVLYKISDYKNALEYIDKLNLNRLPAPDKDEILFIKGSCLIETGRHEDGISILTALKNNSGAKSYIPKINLSLASAEFDLNNYEAVKEFYDQIVNDENSMPEELGKINNLMSMLEFSNNNDPVKALNHAFYALEKYKELKLPERQAAVLVNIGTFYDASNNKKEAEKYWQKALEINASVGNLEQEGIIYLNYGVFFHSNFKYENSIEYWQKAKIIFEAIDLKNSYGTAIGNIGEVNMQCCDYQNSYINLLQAIEIFNEINNKEQELYYMFILGRLFYLLGDQEELIKIFDNYENKMSGSLKESLSDNSYEKMNYYCLKFFIEVLNKKPDLNKISGIYQKIEKYIWENSQIDFLFIYVESLLKDGNYKRAAEILNSVPDEKIIQQNIILLAHQYYLFGKIAQQDQNILNLPAIEYFEKAYVLLEGEIVMELTWKVLYEIANTYFERGNFYKAKQPRIYAFELINLIGENISHTRIRNIFYNFPIRKEALEKLVYMGSQTQFNEYQKS